MNHLMALKDELRRVLEHERLLRKTAEDLVAALQENQAELLAELLNLQERIRKLERSGATSGHSPSTRDVSPCANNAYYSK